MLTDKTENLIEVLLTRVFISEAYFSVKCNFLVNFQANLAPMSVVYFGSDKTGVKRRLAPAFFDRVTIHNILCVFCAGPVLNAAVLKTKSSMSAANQALVTQ